MKEIYDKGFSSMERSHQRVLMQMRKAHKQELESLRQEKEQLLAEETRATQAALDAMRKAQEEELRRERDKFLGIIAKTYSQTELEALQTQHESVEDMELLQWEMKQLMEQYSLRCLENAALHQRMEHQTSALQQSRSHSHTLKDK
ncbi:hypothetical protein CAPTEDRAFT_108200 [Capitella teleta]|uniref:Uncharacterized protein n=1 Tax=Capitella teleta TaxID=283909 RepID=R7U1W8_CAPTE|nr:hypothetical protein CAPTEDRAFT_108200 [Capitella teleta]|eukprot:ELT97175.1 hypothetical protein CAPTEDRAFT_108200 [Capitella teleta]